MAEHPQGPWGPHTSPHLRPSRPRPLIAEDGGWSTWPLVLGPRAAVPHTPGGEATKGQHPAASFDHPSNVKPGLPFPGCLPSVHTEPGRDRHRPPCHSLAPRRKGSRPLLKCHPLGEAFSDHRPLKWLQPALPWLSPVGRLPGSNDTCSILNVPVCALPPLPCHHASRDKGEGTRTSKGQPGWVLRIC